MRAVIQRVLQASVTVEGAVAGQIGSGMLVLLGVGKQDGAGDAEYLAEKLVNLRIYSDDNGKMNKSILEIRGSILVISQFTLYGDCRKGRRPSFDLAAEPLSARPLYEYVVERLRRNIDSVETGIFGADMKVTSVNDGPVTFILESRE